MWIQRVILMLIMSGGLCSVIMAEVLNVEFNFAPFSGDLQEDHVMLVPGKAVVSLNGVPYIEQEISERDAMVLFKTRNVTALWLNADSFV